MVLGERDFGLDELEAIVRELPLSYYMLHAYSRLKVEDPVRAERAVKAGQAQAQDQPFSFEYRPEFDTAGFRRALELLRQGEVHLALRELAALHLLEQGTTPAVLWAVALLYHRAGAAELSHRVARGLLTDWLQRWPTGEWRRAWELAFPRPHHDIVSKNAQKNDVAEALVYGVMREESQFDAQVVSHAGAYGLMQLMPSTARHYGKKGGIPSGERDLKRPVNNIAIGTLVLKSFSQPFANDPLLCIPAYNAGPGRPKRWKREHPSLDFDVWVELIPFRETRRYMHRVLAARAAYGYLYDTTVPAEEWLTLPLRFAD
jgi:soluble lytic murein transglycosylase